MVPFKGWNTVDAKYRFQGFRNVGICLSSLLWVPSSNILGHILPLGCGRLVLLQRMMHYSHTEFEERRGTWWVLWNNFWAPWRCHKAWGRCHTLCLYSLEDWAAISDLAEQICPVSSAQIRRQELFLLDFFGSHYYSNCG